MKRGLWHMAAASGLALCLAVLSGCAGQAVVNEAAVRQPYFSGNATAVDYTDCDIDRSGAVDDADGMALRRYVAGWDTGTALNLSVADVNGDGKVNSRDVTLLRRYLAFGATDPTSSTTTTTTTHITYDDTSGWGPVRP